MPWGPRRSILAGGSGIFFFLPGVFATGAMKGWIYLAFWIQGVVSFMSDYWTCGMDSAWHGADRWMATIMTVRARPRERSRRDDRGRFPPALRSPSQLVRLAFSSGRREKSSRIGVHIANGVVWEAVSPRAPIDRSLTSLALARAPIADLPRPRPRPRPTRRSSG